MTPSASRSSRLAFRLAVFNVFVFSIAGVALPFWPVWLKSRGLDAGQVGLLLSLAYWIRVVGNPFIPRWADRVGLKRALILAAAGSFFIYALFGFAGGFWHLLLLTILSGLCLTALGPLNESLMIGLSATGRIDYGRVRVWGSLSFIATGLGAGALLVGRDADMILLLMLAALLGTVLSAFQLPPVERHGALGSALGWRTLVADRPFLLVVAVSALLQSSHGVLYGFGTLHWLAAGYDKDTVGLLWAIGTGAEILLFWLASAVGRRVGVRGFLLLGGLASVLRWLLAGVTVWLPGLLAIQLLHAFSFGATHLAVVEFIRRRVPLPLMATAQGLHSAVAWGAAFGLAMWVSGMLYEALAGAAFFAMAAMAAAGCLIAVLLPKETGP